MGYIFLYVQRAITGHRARKLFEGLFQDMSFNIHICMLSVEVEDYKQLLRELHMDYISTRSDKISHRTRNSLLEGATC